MPKVVMWGRLTKGKRRQGGPRKRWVDGVMGDLGELGVGESWKEECADRTSWAKLIAPRKGTATKAEVARAQRKDKGGLGGVGGKGVGGK